MSAETSKNFVSELQGPQIAEDQLRHEAVAGPSAFISTAAELAALPNAGCKRVDSSHVSHVDLRGALYRWGNFEPSDKVAERLSSTVRQRARERLGKTLVFVSHGAPTQVIFKELTK